MIVPTSQPITPAHLPPGLTPSWHHTLCALLALASLSWSGCATSPQPFAGVTADYQPNNVYRAQIRLPLEIRRVAVLPLSTESGDWQADAARTVLQSVLLAELVKCKTFETVLISPDEMTAWTHRASWRSDEALPANLLGQMRQSTGCDAVLFAHLRPYHAYEPLVIGWNLKLAEARSGAILWSADEVFDASEAPVARTAVAYQRRHAKSTGDACAILSSPRLFGQYTLSALLATLPAR